MNKKPTLNLTGNYSPQISGYSKLYKTLAVLFLLFGIFIIGCKKDDFQGEVVGLCPVVTSDPMDKAVDVALDKVITITFNTVMSAATVNNSTFTIKQNGNLVAGTIAPTTNSAVFTFKPAALLNPFLVYEGRVTTGVRDTLRTAMENDYVFTFTSIPQISVTASPLNAGTTTGSGNFAQGSTTTVTATPNANSGFVFSNFTRNGVIVSRSSSYQFKVDGNIALVANFIPVPIGNSALTLSSNPSAGGSTTGQGPYPTGSVVTATAIANPGYTFMNWTENGLLASRSSNYTFTLTRNTALVANFLIIPASQFAVNLSSNPAAGGSTDGEGSYNANSSVEVNAIPNADYNFVNWTENGVEVSRGTKYIFVLTATRNLVANFALKTFRLNVTLIGGGIVDRNPNQQTYTTGSSVQLRATANPGFQFTGWSVDAVGSANPLTVVMDRDKNITATFVRIQFTLTVNAQNGTVDRNPNQPTYASGTTVQLTPRPAPGYEFVDWSGDATGTANPLPVLMDRNKTITANFTPIIIPNSRGPILPTLGTAGNYAILTKSGITTTGVTLITGNIGISPISSGGYEGFSQAMDPNGQSSTSPLVNGKLFAANYAAPTPDNLRVAVDNMETAFTNSNNLTVPAPTVDLGAGNISGRTIQPGLYKFGTGLLITSQGVTLQGNANDTWVFTVAGDLTVENTAKITLGPGVQAKNIYWVVSGQAVLGTDVDFSGIILSKTLISLQQRTRVNGRLLAQTAVTLIGNTVTQPQ